MPESVWDSIYKGIKDFAGDENKANALIGGGIGAGIGGLIDGWRGAGIGAVGGGIAGYKSNDIKKWWNTPTEELKNTPPKVDESTKANRELAEKIFTNLNEKQKQKLQDLLRDHEGLNVYDLLIGDIKYYNEVLSEKHKQVLKNVFNINNAQEFIDYEKNWSHQKNPDFRAHFHNLATYSYNSLHDREKQYLKNNYNIIDEKSYSDYILKNVDEDKFLQFIYGEWYKE